MGYVIPEKGINFAVYLNGREMLGAAEIEMPTLEAMTSEVKGAGVAGVLNTPVLGHFNSITMTLTWRNTTDDFFKLAPHKVHELTLYEALQDFDATAGEYEVKPLTIFVKGIPLNSNLGKASVGETMDTQTELEIYYIKVTRDGKDRIELDKMNYIFKVDGKDYLAAVRSALGK